MRAFAATLGPNDQVFLEATINTWAIADLLRTRAGRVVVSNPMRTRAIADAKIKTDRVDAAVLAQLLAADFNPEVWMPDEATRERRRRSPTGAPSSSSAPASATVSMPSCIATSSSARTATPSAAPDAVD